MEKLSLQTTQSMRDSGKKAKSTAKELLLDKTVTDLLLCGIMGIGVSP
jgi:hypothetical protein